MYIKSVFFYSNVLKRFVFLNQIFYHETRKMDLFKLLINSSLNMKSGLNHNVRTKETNKIRKRAWIVPIFINCQNSSQIPNAFQKAAVETQDFGCRMSQECHVKSLIQPPIVCKKTWNRCCLSINRQIQCSFPSKAP